MELVFEWDPSKDRANFEKHSVTFTEATSVFSDPLARIFADERHATEEQREIIIGHSRMRRLLLVCFTDWFVSPNAGMGTSGSSAHGVPPGGNSATMKNTSLPKTKPKQSNGLQPEYRFDYAEAKPNRFAGRVRTGSLAVLLDPDVAQVFQDAESVNSVLRALLTTMPARRSRGTR